MPTSMRKNILQLGISPTGGLPAMACESSQTFRASLNRSVIMGPLSLD